MYTDGTMINLVSSVPTTLLYQYFVLIGFTDVWQPRAALIRLTYSSTPSHDRVLKDIVLFFVLLYIANPDIRLLSPSESDAIVQVMEDIPELALDIATSTL